MKLKLQYVLSAEKREEIRLDCIEAELRVAESFDSLADSYEKMGEPRLAQQMKNRAKRCRNYAEFLRNEEKS